MSLYTIRNTWNNREIKHYIGKEAWAYSEVEIVNLITQAVIVGEAKNVTLQILKDDEPLDYVIFVYEKEIRITLS